MPPNAATALARSLEEDHTWLRRLSVEIGDAIGRDVQQLGGDSELRAATRASVQDNVDQFAAMYRQRQDPAQARLRADAAEWVRILARRGIGAEVVNEAYRVGHMTFWRAWVARLHEALPEADIARALEEGSAFMFTFVDAIASRALRVHAEERARWVRSADAVRSEIVRALLDGAPLDLRSAEQRLRYALDRVHVGFIVWSGDGVGAALPGPELEAVMTVVADALDCPAPLTLPLGRGVRAGWVAPRGATAGAAPAVPTPPVQGARIALGGGHAGAAGFRRTHQEAAAAQRVARLVDAGDRSVTAYEDVALMALASGDLEQARRFATDQLGRLGLGGGRHAELVATLLAYLTHQSSVRVTAHRLGVHPNTVANRLARAQELLDGPIDGRVPQLLVALELLPILRS